MMLHSEGFNKGHTLPLALVLIIGMILGWFGFILFGDFAGNTSVVYVSAKEVLKLDKDRIKASHKDASTKESNEGRIFYGYPDQALKLMEKLTATLSNRKTKVVFVSDGSVKGDMVNSVSKQVHAKVLKLIKGKLKSDSLEGAK